jgi:hypothetical protein
MVDTKQEWKRKVIGPDFAKIEEATAQAAPVVTEDSRDDEDSARVPWRFNPHKQEFADDLSRQFWRGKPYSVAMTHGLKVATLRPMT